MNTNEILAAVASGTMTIEAAQAALTPALVVRPKIKEMVEKSLKTNHQIYTELAQRDSTLLPKEKPAYESTFQMVEDRISYLAAVVHAELTAKDAEGTWWSADTIAARLRCRKQSVENTLVALAREGLVRLNSKELAAAA